MKDDEQLDIDPRVSQRMAKYYENDNELME
jgi:hypothetical protein